MLMFRAMFCAFRVNRKSRFAQAAAGSGLRCLGVGFRLGFGFRVRRVDFPKGPSTQISRIEKPEASLIIACGV